MDLAVFPLEFESVLGGVVGVESGVEMVKGGVPLKGDFE
jgi:hypothetical protein